MGDEGREVIGATSYRALEAMVWTLDYSKGKGKPLEVFRCF